MLIVWGALIALAVGLIAKFAVDFYNGSNTSRSSDLYRHGFRRYAPPSISWAEFGVGAVICCAIIVPLTSWVGGKVAVGNQLNGYQEFWNGFEIKANWERVTCTRDGACVREYDCDPYTVPVTRTRSVPDGNGGTRTETYTDFETRYHSCPYTTEEWTFTVDTTLGEHTIARSIFPTNPEQHRWRKNKPVPDHIDSGVPQFWAQAKARLDAGNPGPVTEYGHEYPNYLLASQSTILSKYSDAVDTYKQAKLLPVPARSTYSHYLADKVYAVGGVRVNENALRDHVNKLNAALGTELQGDLHLVIVPSAKVPDLEQYKGALNAYWQGKELGKRGVAKNAVVVILATRDGQTVDRAAAFTGMPVGNETLLKQIARELPDQHLDARTLLGAPTAAIVDGKAKIRHTDGVLEQILWGQNKFVRISMSGGDADDEGSGYSYLKGEIQPTAGQKAGILSVAALLCLLIWGGFLALDNTYLSNLFGGRRR